MATRGTTRGTTREARYRLDYLHAWRSSQFLTQEELADKAHVNILTVSRLERGSAARLDTVKKLAGALGISVAQLCYEAPEPARVS